MNAQRAAHREPHRKTPAESGWFAPIVNSAAARELIPELVAQYLLAEGWRLKESSPVSSTWTTAFEPGNRFVLVNADDTTEGPFCVHKPFDHEPGWGVSSVNFDLRELLQKSEDVGSKWT